MLWQKTVAQSSTETYGNAVAFGIASAILAENWDNPFAWFMAVVTAGAYHAFGKVTAIPLGDKAEKEAKIVAANLYDSYIDLVKNDILPNANSNKFTNLSLVA